MDSDKHVEQPADTGATLRKHSLLTGQEPPVEHDAKAVMSISFRIAESSLVQDADGTGSIEKLATTFIADELTQD